MVVLLGIAAGLGVLYFWLLGHWFARVVALFPIVIALGAIGYAAGDRLQPVSAAPAPVIAARSAATPTPDYAKMSDAEFLKATGGAAPMTPPQPNSLCSQTNLPQGIFARVWDTKTGGCVDDDPFSRALTEAQKAVAAAPAPAPKSPAFAIIGCVVGVIASWFVSGIPVYVRRMREASMR
jgi:hypothetical protein